jgi:hypothetical protein
MKRFSRALSTMNLTEFQPPAAAEAKKSGIETAEEAAIARLRLIQGFHSSRKLTVHVNDHDLLACPPILQSRFPIEFVDFQSSLRCLNIEITVHRFRLEESPWWHPKLPRNSC